MLSYVFGLISYIGWGAGDIFGATAVRKIGGFQTAFFIMVIAALFLLPLAILYWPMLVAAPPAILLLAIASGFLYQTGNIAVSEALHDTDVSLVLTVMGSFGALIILFSTVFLHEPITLPEIGLISLIFLGVFLCTFRPGTKISSKGNRGVLLSLYSAFAFGLFFTLNKTFTPTLSWFWPLYLSFLWLPVIYIWLRKKHIPVSLDHAWSKARVPLFFAFLCLRGGDLIFNIGLQHGAAAIVAPIGSASPTLSVLLAFLIFRDKPTRRQLLGIVLALLGIVLLGFVGN